MIRVRVMLVSIACATLLGGGVACRGPGAHAVDAGPPRPELVWSTYAIRGDTARELERAMRRRGPRVGVFERRPASTRWSLRWTHGVEPVEGGRCRATGFSTTLEMDVTMPEWADRDGAPASLVARWERFVAALRAHESGHLGVAKEAAADLERRVAALPPAPSCQAVSRDVARVAGAVLRAAREGEARYDARTDHGRSQGAVL